MGKFIERLLGILTILSFAGVIIVVTIQIMSRYLPYTAVWTEELTRYLFLYAICFGTPLALLRNEYINVDLLINKMAHNFRRFYEIAIYVAIIMLNIVITIEGYKFTVIGHLQTAATLPIRMSVIHASIMFMGFFLTVYSVVKIIELVQDKKQFSPYGGEEL